MQGKKGMEIVDDECDCGDDVDVMVDEGRVGIFWD